MKINLLKMKKLNMKKLFLVLYTAIFLIQPAFAQNAQIDKLLDKLDKTKMEDVSKKDILSPGDANEGYKSFVQNELQSMFKQLDAISEQDRDDITFAEINAKREELALALCTRDERACFLVDEYRSYKSKEDMPQNIEDLKLFGSEVFSGYANDFNFYDSLPLGDEYVVKIGDEVKVTLFGGFAYDETLIVDITGSVAVEKVGSFKVAGMPFAEVSQMISNDIASKYIGTEVIVSMGKIRSKQVFVVGNVKTPGTFALNAFGTALNALISSGGVKQNSSLRSIKVLRNKNTIATIDLYNLLINGDASASDFLLSDGDSILVGGLQSSASIIGEVIRPAIYEISQNESLDDIIKFALGTTPFADQSNISVERLLPSGEIIIITPKESSKFLIQNGDRIKVFSAQGQKLNSISLFGAVRNSGEYAIEDKKTLGDLVKVQRDLLESTYTGFAVIKRLNFSSKSYRVLNFSLTNQAELDEINLYAGDKVFIFSKDDIAYSQSKEVYSYLKNRLNIPSSDGNQNIKLPSQAEQMLQAEIMMNGDTANKLFIEPKISECLPGLDVLTENPVSNLIEAKLKIFPSAKDQNCTPIFERHSDLLPILLINSIPVAGNVRFPGLYPTARDLSGLDLFNIAGGFLLSKLNVEPKFDVGIRSRGFGSFGYGDLKDLSNITMLNLQLDESSIPGGYVKLVGEFSNPGIFSISKGAKLSDVYQRAGGLTSRAYPLGGILTRDSIKIAESEALERSNGELSEMLASAVASGYLKQNSTDLVGLISLMTSISNAKPMGRLVTELNPSQIRTTPSLDIALEDGDVIYIPPMQNTVTIVGQVLNPVTVPHKVGASFNDYLSLAGGLKKESDKSKVYAVLPNGISVRKNNGIYIPVLPFMPFSRSDILPGSTIIVPRKARPLDSLALVETVTPILANLSVTAASIAAISDN